MALPLRNSYEGGSDETTITVGNSGGASGDAFTSVTVGTGATNVFDTAQSAAGSLAARLATGGTAATPVHIWDSTKVGTQTLASDRFYVRIDSSAAAKSWRVFRLRKGTSLRLAIQINTANKVVIQDANNVTLATSTTVLSADTWYRITVVAAMESASPGNDGTCTVKIYAGHSLTALETLSASSIDNLGTDFDEVTHGQASSQSNFGPCWVDEPYFDAVSTEPGPAVANPTPSVAATVGAVPTATLLGTAVPTPTVAATAGVVPAATLLGSAIPTPSVAATVGTAPTVAVSGTAQVTPSIAATVSAAPAATIKAGAICRPGCVICLSNLGTGSWIQGIDGAGFCNTIAYDFVSRTLVVGPDLGGIHWSDTGGKSWHAAIMVDANIEHDGRVMSIIFTSSGVGWATTGGSAISNTKLWKSIDSGRTWTKVFENNVLTLGQGNTQPRRVGVTLVADEINGLVYVGSATGKVFRCNADGSGTPYTIAISGNSTCILADPTDITTLYVSTVSGATASIYKITNANGTPTLSTALAIATVPDVHELFFLGTTLYAAAATSGIWSAPTPYTSWTNRSGSTLPVSGPSWCSLTGYIGSGDTHILFAGCATPANGTGSQKKSIMRTADATLSTPVWSSITDTAIPGGDVTTGIAFSMFDSTGEQWWMKDGGDRSSGTAGNWLGRSGYVASQLIYVDGWVYSCGRAGVWLTRDEGTNWYPVVFNLGATVNQCVVTDPNIPGRVYAANTDWIFFVSEDYGITWREVRGGATSATQGIAIAVGADSRVFFAAGERDDSTIYGGVYHHSDPTQLTAFIDTGFQAAVVAVEGSAMSPCGIAEQDQPNGDRVIIVPTQHSGIWRGVMAAGHTTAAWTKVNSVAFAGAQQDNIASTIVWVGSIIYAYDREVGIFRSTDLGLTFTKIWDYADATAPLGIPSSTIPRYTGFVGADPTMVGRIFVSSADGTKLYMATGADVGSAPGSGIAVTTLSGIANPGALTVGTDGSLIVVERPSNGHPCKVWRSFNGGATFGSVSGYYDSSEAIAPLWVTISTDCIAYVAYNGGGILTSRLGPAPMASGRATPTATATPIAVPSASPVGTAKATPTVVVTIVSTPTTTLHGSADAAVATVDTTGDVPAASLSGTSKTTPITAETTSSIDAITIEGSAIASPAVLMGTVYIPVPDIIATTAGVTTVVPLTLITTTTIDAVNLITDALVVPDTIDSIVVFAESSILAAAISSPDVVATETTVPPSTLLGASKASPNTATTIGNVPIVIASGSAATHPVTLVTTTSVLSSYPIGTAKTHPNTIASRLVFPVAKTKGSSQITVDEVRTTASVGTAHISGNAVTHPTQLVTLTRIPPATLLMGTAVLVSTIATVTTLETPYARGAAITTPIAVTTTTVLSIPDINTAIATFPNYILVSDIPNDRVLVSDVAPQVLVSDKGE